jgi:alcohol dehydrogenase (cytochrome c)
MAPSFDPETKLFYVNAEEGSSLWYLSLGSDGKPEGHQGGATVPFWSSSKIVALDYQTGKARWTRDIGEGGNNAGILTTAGHLLFTGDISGNLLALDPSNGEVLWHNRPGGVMSSSPMTYSIDGRQYVLTSAGSVLYAWSLPPHS